MKAITAQEVAAIARLETAIVGLMSDFSSIGSGKVLSRAEAERIIVQRALGINRRGYP